MNSKELEEKIYEFGHTMYRLGRMETDGKDTMKEYNKITKQKEELMKDFESYFKNKKLI